MARELELIVRNAVESGRRTPLLFIHGMMHGAWCWDAHFLGYFAGHGFDAYAVNLRGHGNSDGGRGLRWARIADYVEDVADTVRRLARPPVLIGHSMGGFVIQKYLEHHTAPGAVLLSSPSPRGLVGTALRIAARRPLVFAKVNLALSLLPVIATPQLTREEFRDKATGLLRSRTPVLVTRRGRLAGIFFPRPEITLPIELKRELYDMLSRDVARQLKRRRVSEADVLEDFEASRKKRRAARRRR